MKRENLKYIDLEFEDLSLDFYMEKEKKIYEISVLRGDFLMDSFIFETLEEAEKYFKYLIKRCEM